MRSITLTVNDSFRTQDVLKEVVRLPLGGAQRGGTSVEQMRRDIRVLDAIDAAEGDKLDLEDADWQHLCEKLKAFPFAYSDRNLLKVCDEILGADAVTTR